VLWIVGGAVLALLVAGAAVVVVTMVAAARGPQDAVMALDRAFDEADCDLYLSITTPAYQESYVADCEQFEFTAQEFSDNYSDYSVAVTSSSIDDDSAVVDTTETYVFDGEQRSDDFRYSLVRVDDAWLIDSVAPRE